MKATHRRWWWIAGGAGAALAVWLVARPSSVPVSVVTVARAPLEVLVIESGETRAVNHTVVAAPVSGMLHPLVRDEGTPVTSGTALARLEPAALDARTRAEAQARSERADAMRTRALAGLRTADSALRDARRAQERAVALARAGALAARDAEQATIAATVAEDAQRMAMAALREAEAERHVARSALASGGDPIIVRAPVAGVILGVHERDPRVVLAGTPLVSLGDTDAIDVRFDVLSRDALRLVPGQALRLDFGPGLEAVPGTVQRVEPGGFAKRSPLGVEERRVRVIGRALRALPGVGDGFRVQVSVVVWAADRVLQVPASAFVRNADGWAVYVVADGRVRRRAVVPGERGTHAWEVRAGLAEGDVVIRFPDVSVTDGVRARVVPE